MKVRLLVLAMTTSLILSWGQINNLNPELYHYMFNTGSEWFYEKEGSQDLDTVSVSDLYAYPLHTPFGIVERFKMELHGSNFNLDYYQLFIGYVISLKDIDPEDYIFMCNYKIGERNKNTSIKDTFNVYTVNGQPFSTVTKMLINPNPHEGNVPTHYYFAKDFGIIRKELLAADSTTIVEAWNLINWNLIQAQIGIEEDKTQRYKIYPNPVNNHLSIECRSLNGEPFVFKLVDMNGKIVCEETVEKIEHTVDFSQLSSGVYLLEVISGNQIHREKIVKH